MVTVVSFYGPAMPSLTDVDLAGFLEDKIAQLVGYSIVPTTGVAVAQTLEANGRVLALPAGTTVGANSIRLVNWTTINPGTDHLSVNMIQLTVLYLKDAPGKYP